MKSQQSGVVDIDKDEMKQIGDIISDLKKSPVFNMSLTSKELFHSNFIAWMIETDEINSSALLELFSSADQRVNKNDPVRREVSLGNRKKIDLLINMNDEKKIFIENKVKSLPDQIQLDEYSKLIKKNYGLLPNQITCILISLTSSDLFKNSIYIKEASYDWRFVSYKKLAIALKKIAKSAMGYHKMLIEDYAEFIEHLCSLHDTCEKHWGKGEPSLASYGGTLYNKMKEIRFHDIYEKWRMEALKKHLINNEKFESSKVVLSVDYTNGQGILNIDPKGVKENSFYTKLQIQGDKLRQVLQYKGEKKGDGNNNIFNMARDLMKTGWFRKDGKELAGNIAKTQKRTDHGFCKFDSNFAYRYEKKGEWDLDRVIELSKKLDANISKEN